MKRPTRLPQPPDGAHEVAFEDADGLALGLALPQAARDVVLGGALTAQLGQGNSFFLSRGTPWPWRRRLATWASALISDPKRLPPVLPNACVGAGQLAFAARRVLGAEEAQSTAPGGAGCAA